MKESIKNAIDHIHHEAYNDALSSLNEALDSLNTEVFVEVKTKMQLQVGQIWYVRFNGANCLSTQEILSLTSLTVELKEYGKIGSLASRYLIKDIEWVEVVWTK